MLLTEKVKYKAFWLRDDGYLEVIDQTKLPFFTETVILKNSRDVISAIKKMIVRGAGVIGNIAAFGVYLSSKESNGNLQFIFEQSKLIKSTRPTAVNLTWAIDRMLNNLNDTGNGITESLKEEAIAICEEDRKHSELIGKYGFSVIEDLMRTKGIDRINILTHCNAGYLAIIDNGSALAPIYEAKKMGANVHVWVDETRPRNQGANLTAWELDREGIQFTIIPDNTGGLLMQKNMVDLVLVGADRVTRTGDVANKIGTYLKALSAYDNDVPFYSLFPSSTFDFNLFDGISEILIETRDESEIKYITGIDLNGNIISVQIYNDHFNSINYGFDITPNRLVTGLITERGICKADQKNIEEIFFDLL